MNSKDLKAKIALKLKIFGQTVVIQNLNLIFIQFRPSPQISPAQPDKNLSKLPPPNPQS